MQAVANLWLWISSVRSSAVNRKRKRRILQKQKDDYFARELESAVESASRCAASLTSPAVAGVGREL
ncbi:hypothetical protein TOPH_08776 [Tolypocladium ophioglossoides CBS 100239]|uniref:Uncharacterized protein n=1 Tax=Tolypocladium ophioglossoides (strain CBS 100239) TaxID=1163406 RepID=A0A0L0MXU1_TOLOC|nr:hypothetical protein TOPH_08776 [Tolypocladium ophioglossoides CBS 100239]